jgi:hypothetical protein
MALNKNKILGFSALLLFLLGASLIVLGFYCGKDWNYLVSLMGVGFCIVAWAFNALRGRI